MDANKTNNNNNVDPVTTTTANQQQPLSGISNNVDPQGPPPVLPIPVDDAMLIDTKELKERVDLLAKSKTDKQKEEEYNRFLFAEELKKEQSKAEKLKELDVIIKDSGEVFTPADAKTILESPSMLTYLKKVNSKNKELNKEVTESRTKLG